MQRLLVSRLLPTAVALSCAQRGCGSDETGKKRKVNLDDDDRWLEAEFDAKVRTPEERYAHERQREVMKSILRKMRTEHEGKLESAVAERNEKIGEIKSKMAELEEKLHNLTKGK